MAHIHSEPYQHDLTASAFIVRIDGSEPRLLLHRHRILGKYMQFGGHVELNEHPWEAAAREVREEAGYDFDQLHVLVPSERILHVPRPPLLLPPPLCILNEVFGDGSSEHFHDDIIWTFTTETPPKHELAVGESMDTVLCTRSELVALADDVLADVYELGLYIFDNCLNKLESIPARPLQR